MPIRESEKARYPSDWDAISRRARDRAGNACEFCGVENGSLGGRDAEGNWWAADAREERMLSLVWPKPGEWGMCRRDDRREFMRIIRIVLTVAHLDHTPENCSWENLRALCQRCHLRYDAKHHARNAAETRRKAMGCGDLFAEARP